MLSSRISMLLMVCAVLPAAIYGAPGRLSGNNVEFYYAIQGRNLAQDGNVQGNLEVSLVSKIDIPDFLVDDSYKNAIFKNGYWRIMTHGRTSLDTRHFGGVATVVGSKEKIMLKTASMYLAKYNAAAKRFEPDTSSTEIEVKPLAIYFAGLGVSAQRNIVVDISDSKGSLLRLYGGDKGSPRTQYVFPFYKAGSDRAIALSSQPTEYAYRGSRVQMLEHDMIVRDGRLKFRFHQTNNNYPNGDVALLIFHPKEIFPLDVRQFRLNSAGWYKGQAHFKRPQGQASRVEFDHTDDWSNENIYGDYSNKFDIVIKQES